MNRGKGLSRKKHTCQSGLNDGKLGSQVQPHPPKHADELPAKWRMELIRLTREALEEIEKPKPTRRNSAKPSTEVHSLGAAEAHP